MPQGPEGPPKTDAERAFVRDALIRLPFAGVTDADLNTREKQVLRLLGRARGMGAFEPDSGAGTL